jgi:hypothetical protein
MEVSFDCGCGNRISGVVSGGIAKSTSLGCGECEAKWAVTITNLRDGESAT